MTSEDRWADRQMIASGVMSVNIHHVAAVDKDLFTPSCTMQCMRANIIVLYASFHPARYVTHHNQVVCNIVYECSRHTPAQVAKKMKLEIKVNARIARLRWRKPRACGLTTTSIAVSLVHFRVAQIRNASNQGLQICRRNMCFTTRQYGIAQVAKVMHQVAKVMQIGLKRLLEIRNVTIAKLHVPAARPG